MLERLMQWSRMINWEIHGERNKDMQRAEKASGRIRTRDLVFARPTLYPPHTNLSLSVNKKLSRSLLLSFVCCLTSITRMIKKRPNKRRILNLELRTKQGRTFMIFHNEKQFTKKNQYLDWLWSFHMWPYVETAWPKKGGQGSICLLISDSGH